MIGDTKLMNKDERLIVMLDLWFSSQTFYNGYDGNIPGFMDELFDLIIEAIYDNYDNFENRLHKISYNSAQESIQESLIKTKLQ